MAGEFSLIDTWFAPLSREIGDDCALLELAAGERLAISVDTLVSGVHFLANSPPGDIAYRAVVTALSDLAAMGSDPRGITLALTLPEADDDWMREFSSGLMEVLQEYGVELLGGDTTRGPLTVTVQVMGALPVDKALRRSGAVAGELLYVSGCTGDAAAALAVQRQEWQGDQQYRDYLLQRFFRPSARVELGRQLLDVASSAIDISDGLLADAGHLCERSRVGIRVDAETLPRSLALQSMPDQDLATRWVLSGGDDYELLFTIPTAEACRVPPGCHCIGEVVEGDRVICEVELAEGGYQHFSGVTS